MMLRRRGKARMVTGRWTELDLVGDPGRSPDLATLAQRLRDGLGRAVPFEAGDFLVVGKGFGHPTVSDWAALAFAKVAIGGILAARLTQRLRDSLLQAGVPILSLPANHPLREGDDVIVGFDAGTIEDVTQRRMTVTTELTLEEAALVRDAPAFALYGLERGPADPDVLEVGTKGAPKTPA
jgi:hypothetical protein